MGAPTLQPFEWADEVEQKELLNKIGPGETLNTPPSAQVPPYVGALNTTTLSHPAAPAPAASKPRIEFSPLFGLRHLVDVWYFINPDIPLYPWQKEELYRLSGYLDGTPHGPRIHFAPDNPFLASYVCANGSGKDKVIISTLAIGLPLLYTGVYTVITSSSFKQLKDQTELHITNAIKKLNAKFREAGSPVDLFEIVSFHYRCPSRGAEIVLFATDETGKAEGWHPVEIPGQLVLIINEAKSIAPDILGALDRCWGFSHWVEISSPGGRTGQFYHNFKKAVKHPLPWERFRYYARRVDWTQCPHITIDNLNLAISRRGELSLEVQTGFYANFFEAEEGVVIPAGLVEDCDDVNLSDGTLGFGLDAAAGGDETVLVVRRGNHIIDLYPFVQKDLTAAADLLDSRLDAFRYEDYVFNFDDGGVGRGLGDNLTKLGWRLIRRHNQSTAYNPKEFANLGAEMWWHVRDLFQARKIPKPSDDILYTQLVTRKLALSEGLGKKKLDSKKRIKETGGASPDRADAFVLAFFSYKPKLKPSELNPQPEDLFGDLSDHPPMDYKQLAAFLKRNPNIFAKPPVQQTTGRYTCQST